MEKVCLFVLSTDIRLNVRLLLYSRKLTSALSAGATPTHIAQGGSIL